MKKEFNINKLSDQEVESLSLELGEKVRYLCDKAVERANKVLNKYGLEAKMAFCIGKVELSSDKKDNLISNQTIEPKIG